jgi:RES domain
MNKNLEPRTWNSELDVSRVRWAKTCRLIPTRFPTIGVFDRIAAPADLDALVELEAWTNDRVSTEIGILHVLPQDEWVVGRPMASVVMAAFCHPRPGGGRFSGTDRGAWYAARTLETALAESTYHRGRELAEVGAFETRMQMRLYHADFRAAFHDIRPRRAGFAPLYDPNSYVESQRFGREILEQGSNGIVYRSVRHEGGECVACFRPKLVLNVRVAAHFEYKWEGPANPVVIRRP